MYYRYPEGDFFFEVNVREDLEFDEFIELDTCYRNKKEKCKDGCQSNKSCSCETIMNSNKEYPVDFAKWIKTDDEYSEEMTCK
ncbi:hypothetical protein [Clostridium sardiniense]|uniref:hypothetical protein n=1 Tax=Clostridium sardiniense TaxID=29369 RepID=UPI003D324AB1